MKHLQQENPTLDSLTNKSAPGSREEKGKNKKQTKTHECSGPRKGRETPRFQVTEMNDFLRAALLDSHCSHLVSFNPRILFLRDFLIGLAQVRHPSTECGFPGVVERKPKMRIQYHVCLDIWEKLEGLEQPTHTFSPSMLLQTGPLRQRPSSSVGPRAKSCLTLNSWFPVPASSWSY